MSKPYKILILGASYGSLLGAKLLLAGHTLHLVCLPAEADLINAEGFRVRMPIKGREGLVEIDSRKCAGKLSASGADTVNPMDFDLVGLAMQEPQYRSAGVRELMAKIAAAKVPCVSIMNMPPLPYMARIPGIDIKSIRDCYVDATVWDAFDPACVTLCSPDPQAFRPPEEKVNVLQVRLPTNFKAARFPSDAHTAILAQLQSDIDALRFDDNGKMIELPVKLKLHESVFVPMAKWSMLLAGNYRCVYSNNGETSMRPIQEAVQSDINASREVYNWVRDLCLSLGAKETDLVPFEKYAAAANGLGSPSSAARALFAGLPNIERVDRLVRNVAAAKGMKNAVVDATVAMIDARLEQNRKQAA
jgi:hypothetical protein